MANEVDYNPCKYLGNGSTVEFSFNWKIFNVEDLIVQLEDVSTGEQITKSYGTDYTAIFNETGGHITFNTAPTSSYYVLITRDVSDYQSKRYSTSTGFQGSEVEKSFDRVSCNVQEVEYTLQRAIKVPVGSSILDLTLPLPDAGKTLKWNESETGLVNSTIDVDELESYAERLYESADNIDTVANNILDVNDVADDISSVNTVADKITNVNTVAGSISNVNTVATNISNVNTVKNNIADVNTVAGDIANVNTVAGDKTNIDTVAGDKANIDIVAGDKANIDTVATNINNVNTVATNISKVSTVSTNITDVNNVADDITNINTVAGSISNVDTCATNIEAILDAPNQAETATEQAGVATDKADECIVALAEAESLRNSLRLFSTINAGKLSDTRSIYINAGNISDTRTNYKNGGTLSDWHIAGDDIKNILNLPLLYKQANETDVELAKAEARIAQNESDIATIQEHLATNDDDIDSLEDRVTECESDIEDLADSLDDTNDELDEAEDRITQNESDISYLQYLTDLFNIINSGKLSDTRSNYINAGTLSNTRSNYTNAGTLSNLTVSKDNLRTIGLVPHLNAEIESLKEQLNVCLEFISSIKGGINCGSIVK